MRRFEAGEPAGVHPEVQHRINHLVQEIQYLRAIIDRLQQENAELRRSEAFNSPHQSLPAAGQGAYTLHPPYPSNSLERSPEGYGGNSLALAEMLQPGSYTTSFVGRAQHQDSESSHPGYPVPSPSHGHHTAQPSSPRNSALYQSQQQMDWSTVRHASGGDRAKPASRDGIPSRTLQHSDHGQGDPPQSYLYHSQHQGNAYYQPSTRPPAVRTDGSANNTHHQASHSTSPSSAEPPSAGAIGNSYAGYNAAHSGANGQPQGTALQSPALPDSNPSWHVAGASHLNFHQLGPSLDDAQEYHYHQQQHGHPTQSSFQQHPRSVTQSPVAGVH